MLTARIAAMAVLAGEAAGYDAVEWAGKIPSSAELRNIGIACPAKAIGEALTVRTVVSCQYWPQRSGAMVGSYGCVAACRREVTEWRLRFLGPKMHLQLAQAIRRSRCISRSSLGCGG